MTTKQAPTSDLRAARQQRTAAAAKTADANSLSPVSTPTAGPATDPNATAVKPAAEKPSSEEAKGSEAAPAPSAAPTPNNASEPAKEAPKADAKGSEAAEPAKKDSESEKPAPKSSEGEEKTAAFEIFAAIQDPALVPTGANVEVVSMNEKTATPHWVVFVDGDPVAKLAHTAFPHWDKEGGPAYFMSEKFAKGIKAEAARRPLKSVLDQLGAVPYVAKTLSTKLGKELEAATRKKLEAQFAAERARILDNFKNTLQHVALEQEKNYTASAPLREELFARLVEAGVHDPNKVIEAAFRAAMGPQFEGMFDRAEEIMSMSAEAQADLRKQVSGMAHRMPDRTASAAQQNQMHVAGAQRSPFPFRGQGEEAPSARNSVPIVPRTVVQERQASSGVDSRRNEYKRLLGRSVKTDG